MQRDEQVKLAWAIDRESADELNVNFIWNDSALVAFGEQSAHGFPATVGVIEGHRKHAFAFSGSIGPRAGLDLIPELEAGDDALAHGRGGIADGSQGRDIRAALVAGRS